MLTTHPPYVLIRPANDISSDYDRLDSEPHHYLAAAISDLSEEYWCAGWLIGCEWTLLDMVEGRIPPAWGMGEVAEAELDNLRSIRAACGGGWVAWVGDGVVALAPDEIDATRAAQEGAC